METQKERHPQIPLSMAAVVVALGVVYGDIGTSPLYVMKAIVEGNGGLESLSDSFITGALSLVIWTVTLITSIKYVLIAMQADNHGEGGIFSLYTLVHKRAKWLIIPAMVGGAALLADGILTPAVTVTTAVEGLRSIPFFEGFLRRGTRKNIGDNDDDHLGFIHDPTPRNENDRESIWTHHGFLVCLYRRIWAMASAQQSDCTACLQSYARYRTAPERAESTPAL